MASAVRAHLASGDSVTGAALIGADGLWSQIRRAVVGDGPPRVSGHTTYRSVIPTAQMPEALRWNAATLWAGPKCHIVHYPLSGWKVFNLVVTYHNDAPTPVAGQPVDEAEVMAGFRHVHPVAQDLIRIGTGWKKWVLCDRDPTERWVDGRVALLGDAAHPMMQYFAQGACMAMEDAVCLAAMIGAHDRVEDALEAYRAAPHAAHRPRATAVAGDRRAYLPPGRRPCAAAQHDPVSQDAGAVLRRPRLAVWRQRAGGCCGLNGEPDQMTIAQRAAALLLLASWLTAPAGGAVAEIPDRTIRIGVLNDMSGPYADLSGRGSVLAAQMAAEDFAQLAGPDAPKVTVVGADNQNKADIGAAIARRWVDQDGIDAVVDVPNSAVALAVNQVMREKDRAFLASSTATSDLTGQPMRAHHGAMDVRHLGAGQRHGAGDHP